MRKLTMTENMTPIDKKLIEKGMTRSDLSKQSGVPLRTIESWCRPASVCPVTFTSCSSWQRFSAARSRT